MTAEGLFVEDLTLGMAASLSKTITTEVIEAFAAVSGDTNPVHLDEAFASTTRFGGRIAHGMMTGALISAVIGTKLPGTGSIYMSQSLKFRAPVKVNDTVEATVTVSAIDAAKGRVTLACACTVGETVVADGEALVLVPKRAG